jgi:hypothetical protein
MWLNMLLCFFQDLGEWLRGLEEVTISMENFHVQVAEGGVKEAMLVALKGVMTHAGKSVSAPVLARVVATLQDLLPSEEEEVRTLSATTLGIVSQVCHTEKH